MALNTASYPIKHWKSDATTTGNYPVKTVTVSLSMDENGHQVCTFMNNQGRILLKQVQLDKTIKDVVTGWLDT